MNDGGYSNPALDEMIDKIAMETDQAKRNEMISETIQLIQGNDVALPLHQQVIVWAAKKNVELAQPADDFFPFRFVQMK